MKTTFPMLIRREFWEHRSLWVAPLVWAGVIVFLFGWGMIQATGNEHINGMTHAQNVDEIQGMSEHDREEMRSAIKLPEDRKQTAFALTFLALTGLISQFAVIVVFFYLIDCLYTERKDRSILFWKSMPVSDAEVVLSKLSIALIVVPIAVVLLSAVTEIVLYVFALMRFHGTVIGDIIPDWSFLAWMRSQVVALGVMLGGVLWYAPIAGYLLLLSSWAKNKVFLWAVLPPIALIVLEKIFQGSTHVLEFLGQRFVGYIHTMNLDARAFQAHPGAEELPRASEMFDSLHLSNIFTSTEMWLGLVAAAAMVFVAIRLRRYRDES